MENRRVAFALLAIAPCFGASYRFGALWDGNKLQKSVCLTVQADKIQNVGPCDGHAIDLSGYTAIPGLIDVHTHLTYVLDNPVNQSARSAAVVFLARENARKTLETGVTTARDLGATGYADIAMRDLINKGLMAGPRMFVAGYGLQITRGSTPTPNTADGVAEVMRVVRQQVAAGADWIKMYGSTGSGRDVTGFETFTYEEMKAAVDAAHALGKRIAIHSYGPEGARNAVRAGTDSLEHATDMDDETIAEMARRKIFYVPTIDHNRYYADNYKLLKYPDDSVAGLNAFIQRNLETARKAFRAGVRFAMGSDAVYTMFGENTRELGWFVKAGMTPEQALRTATTDAADLLDRKDSLGALGPGYLADVVAVEGNPLDDIDVVINKVRWVMKGGQVMVDKTK
ncbi:MAG TPA: amidohydrolase family protein [Bryobacteraceae bacterium]|nr:amidohydrolase family protein [Bryobacteraceae bacterium]